jgi:predicted amino acid dehydrogenase
VPSAYFEEHMRRGLTGAFEKVQRGFDLAAREGALVVGLGQYTSIVAMNGRLLAGRGPGVTTGNRLTVGLAHAGLKRALAERGQDLRELRVAVCGAAGNIGRVLAELLLEEAAEVLLVHRESLAMSVKFQQAYELIAASAPERRGRLVVAADASEIATADVVVCATNLAKPFLTPMHLKKGAVVLDVSVPTAVDPAVPRTRPDVDVLLGGFAKLPLGQTMVNRLLPAPAGEVFACMAETVMLGLLGRHGSYSLGALDKDGVKDSLALAALAGISLGSLKKVRP